MPSICELAVFTDRVEETLAFYGLLLGVEPVWQSEDGGQFALGGVKLLVHRAMPEAEDQPPNESHIAVCVADVDSAVTDLLSAGLTIVAGPADYYWGRSAYLRDPDGRLVELSQS